MDKHHMTSVVSGVLVVDKPVGLTSHDVVQIIRRGTGIRRAGHTGTLDPRASGVLVVLIGPAVRLSEFVSAADKRYQATLRLGTSTDTYDAEGQVMQSTPVDDITEEQFEETIKDYIGEIEHKTIGSSIIVDGMILRQGDAIYGAKVVGIEKFCAEFKKNGVRWKQKVRQKPNPAWKEPD